MSINKINDLTTALEVIEYLEEKLAEQCKLTNNLRNKKQELELKCNQLTALVAEAITEDLITQTLKDIN